MSCCCSSLKCCCKFLGGLLGALFPIGVIILIYWVIFQPHQIRATVGSATLTGLTVTNASVVSYRLAVTLDIYNPSLRVGIYHDTLDAELSYRGASLGGPAVGASTASPAEFYQRRKSWKTVKVEFDGSSGGILPGDVAGELEKEMGRGVVSLEVAVDARVRYRFNRIKIRQKPNLWCSLRIPVKADRGRGVGGALTSGDPCSVKY
ncbi:Harpin-induced protein 1 containing protein [Hordeum vulgare]|uniref:Predicted protein n=1 Tax=Hordeum vulgare subsp. vulgare TaxID=112509 RepID=F2DA92_HORVV|nr:uncharacterized protein LOC123395641 [Hordeum vulgare subsp. vulgare]KAE8779173.1 Harpin-induced protein 1 containing protein [Hordeum vulgare]KAI4964590.1 hypothetical protein ZWY2020_005385 [Hordeum vulgare]KAI4987667.1 hypothetical protein ZWY2020_028425 [Hordeum vulgare]BAJ92013.1 predicted protein [Hordeum vulgare subsp. vulgare]